MKLIEIWNNIEILFNEIPIVKTLFYKRYNNFELLYNENIFTDRLNYFIQKHLVNLKNFELINQQVINTTINNYGKKTIAKGNNNTVNNGSNREQYSGYSVDGDFKKTLTDLNSTSNNTNEVIELLNPAELLLLMNKTSNITLLNTFFNEVELLFKTIYPCNL